MRPVHQTPSTTPPRHPKQAPSTLRRDHDRLASFPSPLQLPRMSSAPYMHSSSKGRLKDASPLKQSQRHNDSYDRPSTSPVATNDSAYAFPMFEPPEDNLATPTASSHTYVRKRSRTGPSGKSDWEDVLGTIHLRLSASSSKQHTETLPRTPVDHLPSSESFDQFSVLVAAPVAGVDVMDALVDGMNGGDGRNKSRSRLGIPNHHPLYQPPLPTPPPGIVLGGGKPRPVKPKAMDLRSSDSSEEEGHLRNMSNTVRKGRKRTRPSSSRTVSDATITSNTTPFPNMPDANVISYGLGRARNEVPRVPSAISLPEKPTKSVAPSISDIIRAYAPKDAQKRTRPTPDRSASLYNPNQRYAMYEEPMPNLPSPTEEGDYPSRSSLDSIADEVQQTLKNQHKLNALNSVPPSSFPARHSIISDNASISGNASIYSPRSDPGGHTPSIYSSKSGHQPHSPRESGFLTTTPAQAVAQYLRSARLTTLLKLTRSPHASADNPLTVSLSDLGSRTGYPIVVFLGLGCVRHLMGIYDEMAECMGLRLITIDRWGLGRTEPRHKTAKGIMQWADVVEEVLDLMNIDVCSVMAHSAGAPYALSFANKFAHRVFGDVCLLAPWVGGSENSGYKWLKYVPNGILKTAQAAEWRLQAWMIGKPPTIPYEGIGYTAPKDSKRAVNLNVVGPSNSEGLSRPSMASSNGTFSEYDDLRDFEGRFDSLSILGAESEDKAKIPKRKESRGFINRFKTPPDDKSIGGGKKLKGLRSLSSLKGKNRSNSAKSEPPSPIPSLQLDQGISDFGWDNSIEAPNRGKGASQPRFSTASRYPRSEGHCATSISSSPKTAMSMPSSPVFSSANSTFTTSVTPSSSYQAALGNALIAASHAESAKGTHNDLLQILNHDNRPWGFSYANYPHIVKIWYGEKDERIAENAVRWMERTMGPDKCVLKVVKGADHGLMYRSSVVIEVLEHIQSHWRSDSR